MPMVELADIRSPAGRRRTRPAFPLDLLVGTPDHLRQRLMLRNTLMHEITQGGKVLYAAGDR
jgi:hypothetical protein